MRGGGGGRVTSSALRGWAQALGAPRTQMRIRGVAFQGVLPGSPPGSEQPVTITAV